MSTIQAGGQAGGSASGSASGDVPGGSLKKKLIVCCDGTWKGETFPSPSSNVLRISRCIAPKYENTPQIVYYQSGVGTGTSRLGRIVDGATGRGLKANVLSAYSFICHNYDCTDDEIYLLGFSRGAYTARCVAHLIKDLGILTKSGLFKLLFLFGLWMKQSKSLVDEVAKLEKDGKTQRPVRVKACAVWDTVRAIGIPVLQMKKFEFVHSDLCDNIEHAFQALSLHEHRRHFRPVVWKRPNHNPAIVNTLKQCWFLGYHSDIGGGKKKEALAHLSLVWMMSQLTGLLRFDL
ncbi:hypothetical protein CC80DRAFT_8051, partial [Byssothecium circinans]